jgi:hypothetical protein
VGEGSFLGSQSCTVQTVALGENHFARAMSLNIGTKNHHESKV